MAQVFFKISAIESLTAEERVEQISAELFSISRPPKVRNANDVSAYLFGWQIHPTTGEAVLIADTDYIIKVHPENDLAKLVSLFPTLSEEEKNGLAFYINSHQSFRFEDIIPQATEVLTEEQMLSDGWYADLSN